MGRGRKGSGVEIRGGGIRIRFTIEGKRRAEPLNIRDTPANRRYAERLAADVKAAIDLAYRTGGKFDYAAFFPDSDQADKAGTLRDYGPSWLAGRRGEIGNNTLDQYSNAMLFWYALHDSKPDDPKRPLLAGRPLGDIPIRELAELDLKALIGRHPWPSARLKNNYLIPLRGVFEAACSELSIRNPLAGVKNAKRQKKRPDPFTGPERDQILTHLARHYDARVWAYFNWQFFAGTRPEEAIALRRDKIDFASRTVTIDAVRTAGEDKDHTKTHQSRVLDINDQAWQSIEVMQEYWEDGDHGLVFERPEWRAAKGSKGGKPQAAGPWNDARAQNDTYWKPTLKALEVRYRTPYKTRHTYATFGLMNGVDPAYMADQLGHDQKEFFTTYARWIKGKENRLQLAKINAALPPNLSPIRPTMLRIVEIPKEIKRDLVGAIGLEPKKRGSKGPTGG